ncbi:MAG: mechanosensitive ion channel domain-containing protein, partial [Candidatus Hydrogenedentota bacterium]
MDMKRWMIDPGGSLRVLLIALLIGFVSVPGWSQESVENGATAAVEEAAPGTAVEDLTPEQFAMTTVNLTSPRNTLTTFLGAMRKIGSGEGEYWGAALACISLDHLELEDRNSEGRRLAQELYAALETITLKLDTVPDIQEVAALPEDTEYLPVELSEDPPISVPFYHDPDDGTWRISQVRLDEQVDDLQQIVEEGAAEAKAEAAAEEENIEQGADPRLSNPRKTMTTFLEAFKTGYYEKGGRDDAIATLDLFDVADNLKTEKGEAYAARLKNILDRDHVIEVLEIAPEYDADTQVILEDPRDTTGRRRIELVSIAIREGSEAVEWKFSKESLAILDELWESTYKDREPIAGFQSVAPEVLSLQLQDWVSENTPYLMNELFLFENWKWLGLFFSILLGMIVSRIATMFLLRIVRRFFNKERMRLDEKLERGFIRPIRVGIMAWVWWIALKPLSLPQEILGPLKTVITTVSCMAFVWAVYRLVDIVGEYISEKARQTENKYDDMIVPLIVRTLKIFVLCAGFIFILQMNDQDYKTILAGFGLFGMAMALAAKDTLGNIFGSLTVIMDRPFQIGDWVQVGDVDGSVESVGIRSTRVRTFYNSIVTVPNAILTTAIIDNYGARRFRRYKTNIGITY